MAEYIEREAAVDFAQHAYNEWNLAMAAAEGKREINMVYKRQELCKAVKSVFVAMPSADVAPVVHAEWDSDERCTACGEKSTEGLDAEKWNYWLPPYCPHCGAKMDGERSTD